MRLNQQIRRDICKCIISRRFGPLKAELLAMEYHLALQVYNKSIPKEIQDLMASFPPGYLCESKTMVVHKEPFSVNLAMGTSRRFPFDSRVLRSPGRGLLERVDEFFEEKKQLLREERQASQDTMQLLSQFRSTERLAKAWPQVIPFLPKEPVVFTPGEPNKSLGTDKLNKILGLS